MKKRKEPSCIGMSEREWKRESLLKHERIWDFWRRITWMCCRNRPRMKKRTAMNHRNLYQCKRVIDDLKAPLLRFLPLPDGVVCFLKYSFSTFCVIYIFLCDLQLLPIFSHLQPESANGAMV